MLNPKSFVHQEAQTDVADLILLYLEQIGVEYVFGVPGGAIEPVYNALSRRSEHGGVRPVLACHEAGAVFMADGYARETGKLGVCIGTSGPGATNMITGLANAYENKIPVLAITGQPALPNFGKGALQESSCTGINVLTMMEACTRYNTLVSHSSQLESKLVSAIIATKKATNGPAHLSIPVDIQRTAIGQAKPRYDLNELIDNSRNLVDDDAVERLSSILKAAKAPIFLIGPGANRAVESILKLVEICNGFFLTTPDAKGLINPFHSAFKGVFGFGGHAHATRLLERSDQIIVALGVGFDEFSSGGWSASLLNERLIHVDHVEDNFGRSPVAKMHVLGDIKAVADRVNITLEKELNPDAALSMNFSPHNYLSYLDKDTIDKSQSDATPIKPQRLMLELSRRFPAGTRFLADAGNSMVWAPHLLQAQNRRLTSERRKPREGIPDRRKGNSSWLRVNVNFGSMGWAIGATVGVAMADRSRIAVCITGDGSFLMNGKEIAVACAEGLPTVFVILNDSVYGMVMHGQRLAEAEPIGFELPVVDFRKMAESMGVRGYLIRSPEDFEEIDFNRVLTQPGPILLDVRIDREEIPPMRQRLESLGTARD